MMDVQMKCVHGVDMGMNCGNCGNSFRLLEVPGKSVLVSLDQDFLKAAQALTEATRELSAVAKALNARIDGDTLPGVELVEVKRGPITNDEVLKCYAIYQCCNGTGKASMREAMENFAKSRGLL